MNKRPKGQSILLQVLGPFSWLGSWAQGQVMSQVWIWTWSLSFFGHCSSTHVENCLSTAAGFQIPTCPKTPIFWTIIILCFSTDCPKYSNSSIFWFFIFYCNQLLQSANKFHATCTDQNWETHFSLHQLDAKPNPI